VVGGGWVVGLGRILSTHYYSISWCCCYFKGFLVCLEKTCQRNFHFLAGFLLLDVCWGFRGSKGLNANFV